MDPNFVFLPTTTQTVVACVTPVVYVAAVLAGLRFMRSRAPYEVRWPAVIQSGMLSVASAFMFIGLLYGAWVRVRERGAFALFCDVAPGPQTGPLGFWMYIYWLSKFPELLDTAILIAKKKEVIFLHVFHHATMTVMPYAWLSASWSLVWFGCLINTAIHVFMYFYFAGAALNGYRPWWRQLLTTMQIVQFLLVLTAIVAFQVTYTFFDVPCTAGDSWVVWCSQGVNIVFLSFFIRFFIDAYSNTQPARRQ